VDDRRPEHTFSSKILPPYMRRSPRLEEAVPVLYLRGLSTGDFSEALEALLGSEVAGFSATTVTRLLKVWQEADVTIALPKLKTHGLTTITGATKILFGLVPGLTKSGYHSKLADLDRFCDMLLDIVACVRPALFVMDGVLGIEGNGPSLRGSPRHVGVLLASQDAVALDAVVCQIIGLDPDRLPLFRAAQRRGWWPVEVTVAGTPVAEVSVPDFRLPDTTRAATRPAGRGWLSQLATRALVPRPVPQRELCTACRTCVRICPRQAITIVDQLAVVDDERCIRCYCCHELCPEAAIDLEFSRLGRLLRWTGVLGRTE